MNLRNRNNHSNIYETRCSSLLDVLERRKLDAFFFNGVTDLYYLTGFQSEGFYGLVTPKGTFLFSSALLAGQVRENTTGCKIIVGKRLLVALKEIGKKFNLKRVGFDPDQVIFRLGVSLKKSGLSPEPNPLEEVRIIKGEEEMLSLSRACRITAEAVEHVKSRVGEGMTEKQMAVKIESYFYRRKAEGIAFDLIAAIGSNTALPHHVPGERRLKKNEAVLFDVGCKVAGYRSDLTRTFFYGKITPIFRRIFNIVDQAQKAGIKKVRPGGTGGQVDGASRRVISKAGYGRYFIHSTGHGVGLDIHEPPWIRPKSPDVLKPNMILTVEPGVYLPGKFGVRIEDTLRVTDKGAKVLTSKN